MIQKEGISDAIIRKAAELAGDKPMVIAIALTAAIAVIFTAMSGAGPVIMVSQIAVPLLLSAGVAPVVAASLILFGLNIGLLFNVSQYQLYVDTIGMDMEVIKSTSVVMGVVCAVVTLAYIVINTRAAAKSAAWAAQTGSDKKDVNPVALLMPIVPIVLVFFLKWNAETALIVTLVVTALITKPKQAMQVLSSSVVEGIKDVAGVIGLMVGIGILLNGQCGDHHSAVLYGSGQGLPEDHHHQASGSLLRLRRHRHRKGFGCGNLSRLSWQRSGNCTATYSLWRHADSPHLSALRRPSNP